VRRFRCTNPSCGKQTFAEQFPEWLPVYARHTTRLNLLIRHVGFEVGGEAGRRILRYCNVPVSGDTILRRLRQTDLQVPSAPRVIGVDDWAIKKGHDYGTIIVDLEKHQAIDLLSDRTAVTLARWLRHHSGIEIIARDRSTEYAAGIQVGAPHALQVADRWHLLLNLRQMLERLVATIYPRLEPLTIPEGKAHLFPPQRQSFRRTRAERASSQTSRARRMAQYELIQQLRHEGYNIAQIARLLGLHRDTVRKNFYATNFPERKLRHAERSILEPYLPHLEQRHREGCENAMQLWREIKAVGYPGTPRQALRWMQLRRTQPAPSTPNKYRPASPEPVAPTPSEDQWLLPSPKQLAWLLVRNPDNLTEQETIIIAHLQKDPDISIVYPLARQFASMIRERSADLLDTWLDACLSAGVIQLYNFAIGIQQDCLAIRAALETPWSNGQTEGQVNRLKFIKRQMYGRAHFDLLRLRVLYAPGFT
jgi:transposase